MLPDNAKGWLQTLLPLAQQGGPVVSLILGVLFVASMWWSLGVIRECVDRNRLLGTQLVTQQEKFHAEILLHLSRCAKAP